MCTVGHRTQNGAIGHERLDLRHAGRTDANSRHSPTTDRKRPLGRAALTHGKGDRLAALRAAPSVPAAILMLIRPGVLI